MQICLLNKYTIVVTNHSSYKYLTSRLLKRVLNETLLCPKNIISIFLKRMKRKYKTEVCEILIFPSANTILIL